MPSIENAKLQIKELIEKYNRVVEENRIGRYNEEETKQNFILPLFEALGWNVYNKSKKNDSVSAEEKISKKRVDYGFRINGIPKFFLEAKSLKEDLDTYEFINQAINYSWLKVCTWAILTNFKEVKIFNAEWKTINFFQNHLKTIKCEEFLDRFDELWLLSKESFENDLLDKEAEKWGKKMKRIRVDKQLLEDFTEFREMLSKNINEFNKDKLLSEEDIDESVQRILDRLIFIRNCEDKELEEKILTSKLREWRSEEKGRFIEKLRKTFAYLDGRYNSKLFHNHLCDSLEIGDNTLAKVVHGLSYTKDGRPYDFSVIEADVLGNIYEQYLSHILKKTEKRAKLTENHNHRKEQGIYYTPTYIVDYIVRNTLGELLKDKNVNVEKIRVLDLACGSGSFLIKTFDILNEYWKTKDKNYNNKRLDIENGNDDTYTKKKEILLSNIFGVDLDKQAVEIAELNLLLKIAEKGKKLPELTKNIKCGNSLIDSEEVAGNKAFKWENEFKEIMKDGGFDVVIGNPPYVRQEDIKEYKPFFERSFTNVYSGIADLYVYFFERGLSNLKESGYFGFIVSNKFMRANYGRNLRKYIQNNFKIISLIDKFNGKVFVDATVDPCIIILKKEKPNENHQIIYNHTTKVFQNRLSDQGWSLANQNILDLKNKIEMTGIPLKNMEANIYRGITTGLNDVFIVDENMRNKFIKKDKNSVEILKPILRGKDIDRYSYGFKGFYLIYTYTGINIKKYHVIYDYLKEHKNKLVQVWEAKHGKKQWYELRGCDYYQEFEKEKIVWQEIAETSMFSYDKDNYFATNTAYIMIGKNLKYLLGLLNSKLIDFYFSQISSSLASKGKRHIKEYVEQIPIKLLPKSQQQPLIKLVDKILSLNKKLNEFGDKKTDERQRIEDEIKKIDAEIDEIVYQIYGITEEEKKIIEESLK